MKVSANPPTIRMAAAVCCATLLCLPLGASAQFPSIGSFTKLMPGAGGSADVAGQGDALVRGYISADKDVLLANSAMADALGLKDQAAASRATADALTEGSTQGGIQDADKVVASSTDAVAAEMAKSPKLDAAAKQKYQAGMLKLAQGLIKYIALRGPAQQVSAGIKTASPLVLVKMQSAAYVLTQLPTGISNLSSSLQNAAAFAKSNNIPVPPDATSALASL